VIAQGDFLFYHELNALSYGVFEMPMGWAGDRFSQGKILARIVGSWSLFTIATGLVSSFYSLLAVRFAFGAAEAGAFPTMARALARWFPSTERGRANGVMWMGARLGGALAPLAAASLIANVGWRRSFALFGAIGLVWLIFFRKVYRDDPAAHPDVNAAELAHIQAGQRPMRAHGQAGAWQRIFRSPNMWALFAMYFSTAYGFWFLISWLPTYLMREHGQSLVQSGLYSTFPLALGAIACLVGGACFPTGWCGVSGACGGDGGWSA